MRLSGRCSNEYKTWDRFYCRYGSSGCSCNKSRAKAYRSAYQWAPSSRYEYISIRGTGVQLQTGSTRHVAPGKAEKLLITFFTKFHERMAKWPDAFLTLALMLAAFVIFCIALLRDKQMVKAIALAYIVFP